MILPLLQENGKNSQTDLVSENEILPFFKVFNPFTNIYV
jgi:hypothetical protein